MTATGGLKLALHGTGHSDLRLRFAHVCLTQPAGASEVDLVTDARGRLRCRLEPGKYHLQVEQGGDAEFAVKDGWTPVRITLPES